MNAEELAQAVDELDQRVERLRVLYDQYFMGIEKIPPEVVKKDVERRVWILRREKIRNTGIRFRFQQIIQRYNTFTSYWQRICREIENGTYKRDVIRAKKRFGPQRAVDDAIVKDAAAAPANGDILAPPQGPPEIRSESDDIELQLDESDLSDDLVLDPGPLPVPDPYIPGSPIPSRSDLSDAPKAGREKLKRSDPPMPGREQLDFLLPPPAFSPIGALVNGIAPAAPLAKMPARPPVRIGTASLPASLPTVLPSKSAAKLVPAVPAPRPSSVPGVMIPAAVPRPQSSPPLPPPEKPNDGHPAGDATVAPALRVAAASASVSRTGQTPQSREPQTEDFRQVYSRYVEAKRRNGESTAGLTYDALVKQLRDTSEKLKTKAAGKTIAYEVVLKDGKTILKPTLK